MNKFKIGDIVRVKDDIPYAKLEAIYICYHSAISVFAKYMGESSSRYGNAHLFNDSNWYLPDSWLELAPAEDGYRWMMPGEIIQSGVGIERWDGESWASVDISVPKNSNEVFRRKIVSITAELEAARAKVRELEKKAAPTNPPLREGMWIEDHEGRIFMVVRHYMGNDSFFKAYCLIEVKNGRAYHFSYEDIDDIPKNYRSIKNYVEVIPNISFTKKG